MKVSQGKFIHVGENCILKSLTSSLALSTSAVLGGYATINGIVAGHDFLVHVIGKDAGGNFRVGRYYSNLNESIAPSIFPSTGITDARDVAVVVAPEPASMIAMGAGLVGFFLRKRRSRS